MKSLFRYIFAAAVLLGALSCQRNPLPAAPELPEGPPMLFSAGGSGMHIEGKAGAELQDPTSFQTVGNSFAVYGTWTVSNGTSANVFTKQTVTLTHDSNDGLDKWLYSPLRYWQKSGKYQFRAVYPTTAATTSSSNASSLIVTYSMSTEDYDLMVACSRERDMALNDTTIVDLEFRHACAAIRFLFRKGTQATADYHLKSFELQYILSVGSLVFVSTDDTEPLDGQWWVADDFRPSSIYSWSGNIQVPALYEDFPGSGTTWEEWHCVIPQRVYNRNSETEVPSVRFSSSILEGSEYTDPAFTTIELPSTYMDGSESKPVYWEAGKMYTYYIQIQPGGAQITVETTDWDSYKVAVEDMIF
ncbi:MAG: fimbrillin family protein [Bacteroidales bacterium]|nr:fimbrillin family protein [Bacteroidales bacterium]